MFAIFTDSKHVFTVNLNKILFFYSYKNGTRLEMEDGTIFDVQEKYDDVNRCLEPKIPFHSK